MPQWDIEKPLCIISAPDSYIFEEFLEPSGGRHPRSLASRTFGAAAYHRVACNSSFRSFWLSAYEIITPNAGFAYTSAGEESGSLGVHGRDGAALLSSSTVRTHLD